METILKCPYCKEALMLIKEPKQTKSGKSKVLIDKLKCKNCGQDYRDNPQAAAFKRLKK